MRPQLHGALAPTLLFFLSVGQAAAQTAPTAAAPIAAAEPAAPSSKDSAAIAGAATPPGAGRDAAAAPNSPAAALPPGAKPTPPPADASNIRVEKTGGNRLFRITEGMLVEGQRQKPNAFYVLQRASAAYDWESLDENFLQRIIKATEKPPF
jgi:hypothetical protein